MSALYDRVANGTALLTETEQKIVDALLHDRRETAFLSGPKLAERLNVHEAAATRLAQKLGYKGYPQLRSAVQKEMIEGQDAAVRMRRSLASAGPQGHLAALVAAEVEALETLARILPQAEIDRAADMIFAARRVFLFGQGHAQAITAFLQRRLDRFGISTVALSGRGRDIAEKLVALGSSDLVLALAFRRQPSGYGPLMAHAQAVSAPTLLISDLAGLAMEPRAGLVLAAPRGRSGQEFQTPAVPFAIVGAILLTLAARHEAPMLSALDRLNDLFTRLDDE